MAHPRITLQILLPIVADRTIPRNLRLDSTEMNHKFLELFDGTREPRIHSLNPIPLLLRDSDKIALKFNNQPNHSTQKTKIGE